MPSNHLMRCCPLFLQPSIFPSIRVFQMSQLFTSRGQSIGASASTSVLPMNTQDWSPLGWNSWISLQPKGLARVFNTTVQKHQFFGAQLSSESNSHIHTCFYIFQVFATDTGPGPAAIPHIFTTPGVMACQVTHIFVIECIFLFPW